MATGQPYLGWPWREEVENQLLIRNPTLSYIYISISYVKSTSVSTSNGSRDLGGTPEMRF